MTIHHFAPVRYYITIGTHEPALHIADGDTVVTTTLDADGVDEHGRTLAAPANPQTGPFFVEGAEPGDTLAVHFDRLHPNRGRGYTATTVALNALDPAYVRTMPPRARVQWELDLPAGRAAVVAPPPGLAHLSLPLEPMLGCFGVAPADGQAISTMTSGPYGGNMDYRGFTAGVTAYLPVFAAGALFFLGDGHAVQGDGEIVGTGIEVSFDVQFTVRLLKRKRIDWPRGETPEAIFTAGNARPLDQALQHATTEMLRWLQDDYSLDVSAASILLGQCVRYEVGNVYDPAYTMICKVAKRWLPENVHVPR